MFGWFSRISKKAKRDSSSSSGAGAATPRLRPVDLALQYHQDGRLSEAEVLYREVLAADPENIDALHFLGVISHQRGDYSRAVELISRALARNAYNAPAHCNLGAALSAQGRWREALASFLDALALQPDNADALCNLGAGLRELGKPEKAAACLRRALSIAPNFLMARSQLEGASRDQQRQREALAHDEAELGPEDADAHISLARRFGTLGELDNAVTFCQRALLLAPDSPSALYHLGNALKGQGKRGEAVAYYRKALAAKPDFPDALVNLGNLLHERGELDEAIACCEHVLELDAEVSEAHFNLGNALRDRGRLEEAASCYERAIALAPDLAAAYVNLGNLIVRQGGPGSALAYFRKALALEPDLAEAHYNLGVAAYHSGDFAGAKAALAKYLQSRPNDEAALITLGDAHRFLNELDEGREIFERALRQTPTLAAAHNGLANILRNQGRQTAAVRHYELAIRHDPNPVVPFQNLLFCMMCVDDFSAQQVYDKHREFAERFEKPLLPLQPAHANEPDPDRRIRIGYMSPDLRTNIVGDFVEPILRHHDRREFETHCFFTGVIRDRSTDRIAAYFDDWHDVHALSDDGIAHAVRSHRIDVLVDLCGHGAGNRVLACARKPAPVQVSYLDYSTTTGLVSFDYRLTTEYCDPSGIADRYYSEKLYRLGRTCWAYNPSTTLSISSLPLKANGHVTFGSFNSYYRITTEVVDVWSRLLQSVPGSRFVIAGVAAGSTQAALLEALTRASVAAERVSMYTVISYEKYYRLVGAVDIALAPFPYNGTTTMLDCLWNGVPVVARKGGETFYSRMACSILDELGLSRLIASGADEYIGVAAELAADVPELDRLRRSLRQKLERSPMRDFAGFTKDLESAYRSMWKNWCASQRVRANPQRAVLR